MWPNGAKQTKALRCIFNWEIQTLLLFFSCDLYILVIYRAVWKIAALFFQNIFFSSGNPVKRFYSVVTWTQELSELFKVWPQHMASMMVKASETSVRSLYWSKSMSNLDVELAWPSWVLWSMSYWLRAVCSHKKVKSERVTQVCRINTFLFSFGWT